MRAHTNDTDGELIIRLAQGDQQAFEIIYVRYANILYRYVFYRIRIKEDSQEIIQELFVWLWTHHKEVSHVDALKPYLFNALRYKMVNYFKHNAVRKKYAEHFALFEAGEDSPDRLSDFSDIKSLIEKSTMTLPDRCRTAFIMSRVDNLPIARIAEQMNISHRTVENYITNALRHLRMTWKNMYSAD